MLATEDVFPNIREIDINSNYETDTSEQPLSLTLGPSICFQGVLREGTLICTIWVTSWCWAGKYEPSEKAEHSLVSQVQEKHTKVSTFIEVLYLTSLARKYNLTWHYILPIHGNGYKLKLQKMSSLFVFHVSPFSVPPYPSTHIHFSNTKIYPLFYIFNNCYHVHLLSLTHGWHS